MSELKKIAILDDETQALLLDLVLNELDIPHEMRSYHSAAYDGLFQTQNGWGHVEAPGKYEENILHILEDLKTRNQIL